ncbi:glycosyltransferase [Taklimakanibacter deserti]|uniref:glycosyltransferase n=1 Tax=Taklimakanibacter deserti TaxID=2267839 RepID=UPI000E65474C
MKHDMQPIALDRHARLKLLAESSERRAGEVTPVRWHGLLDLLSRSMSGVGAAERDWRYALIGKARIFAWQPSLEAIAATLSNQGLVYLCWGIPARRGWKHHAFVWMLRRARHVLVNDVTTGEEVKAISGRIAVMVPFFIDMDYFTFSPIPGRSDFLFCNGSNDRDPSLLLALAESGFRIVWLVNDPKLKAQYEKRHPLLELRSRISFEELRELYQTCALNIMPSTRDTHCAGQTTCMEALACGAPVVISTGRTASIFSDLPSVSTVAGKEIATWITAIRDLLSDRSLAQRTEHARHILALRCSRDRLEYSLAPFLGWGKRNWNAGHADERQTT